LGVATHLEEVGAFLVVAWEDVLVNRGHAVGVAPEISPGGRVARNLAPFIRPGDHTHKVETLASAWKQVPSKTSGLKGGQAHGDDTARVGMTPNRWKTKLTLFKSHCEDKE
jgi:hypothetical protein